MKSALGPHCRLKPIWKAMSSEETQTLSLCQRRIPGDGVLLARVLSRQGVGEPLRPFCLCFPGRPGSATRRGQGVGPHERFPPTPLLCRGPPTGHRKGSAVLEPRLPGQGGGGSRAAKGSTAECYPGWVLRDPEHLRQLCLCCRPGVRDKTALLTRPP